MSKDNAEKSYFINTAVDEVMFKAAKKKSHRKEITRSDYVRSLLNEDLKDEMEEIKKNQVNES